MADQGSGIRRRIRTQEASTTTQREVRGTGGQNEALGDFASFCRKAVKWSAITLGGLVALVAVLGTIAETTATPEEKARWAQERAAREQERERERIARAEREAEDRAARQQAEAQEAARRAQFKCLTKLDGSMHELGYEVKHGLRDPDSFEHIQSFATPVDESGFQRVRMKFRARNGFGGMNIEMVEAVVRNKDCKLISWSNLR